MAPVCRNWDKATLRYAANDVMDALQMAANDKQLEQLRHENEMLKEELNSEIEAAKCVRINEENCVVCLSRPMRCRQHHLDAAQCISHL